MKKYFKFIPAVYLVLRKDNKVLLSRRFNTGYQDGNYSMIAGHVDGDEPLTAAMAREALEEAGIVVQEKDMLLIHTMHTRSEIPGSLDDERVDFYFAADIYEGDATIQEPHKCDDMSWFDLDALPENIVPRVKQALEHIKIASPYSKLGW